MAVGRRQLARGDPWPSPATRRSLPLRARQAIRPTRAPGHNARPPADLNKDQELAAYRDMLLIRRFEEKAGQMYGMGLIGGFCHLYIGQEAVVVGMQMALKQGDAVITGYRDHGHMLACGMDAKGVMAELTGRAQRLFPAARAARCTCSPSRRASSAATASSARRCRSAPASPSPAKYRGNDNVSPDLFRRRRRQPGPGLRELQHGEALEAAGDLHHREQPLRHGHLAHALLGDRPICPSAARRSRHSGRAGRRHGRARREGRGRQGGANGAARARARSSSRC